MAKKVQGMPSVKYRGHVNSEGKPTNDRGKPPHKGGHRSGSKRNVLFKIGGDGSKQDKGAVTVDSPWNPGKCYPSAKFKPRA